MVMRIQLESIEKSYGSVKALEDISLEITGGKIMALLGVNGAGKTTLLRILAGLEKQDKGSILFNGNRAEGKELRQIASLVFQKTAMFSRSVYDNLAYGLKIRGKKDEEIREALTRVLQAVGLRDFEKRKAKKISGGEQQRIALARAFLINPKILLLDEPTANLDPNNAAIIERAIMGRTGEKGIIVLSTHNLSQAKRMANEVIHIHGGKIVEVGDSKDFFSNPSSEISRKFINGELDY